MSVVVDFAEGLDILSEEQHRVRVVRLVLKFALCYIPMHSTSQVFKPSCLPW